MLDIIDLVVAYDEVRVLHKVNLQVQPKEIVALVGANGAGKTTLMKTVMSLLRPLSGRIEFEGRQLNNLPPEMVAHLGLSLVPEGRRIFPGLTVLENLEVATAGLGLSRAEWNTRLDEVYELFPVLLERKRQQGWSLSGGEQQMLALARGMVRRPKLLLLDEPSLGLAPRIVTDVFEAILKIHERGTTVLLVEQNARAALSVAGRLYVMQNGSIVLSGDRGTVENDKRFQDAYLGAALE